MGSKEEAFASAQLVIRAMQKFLGLAASLPHYREFADILLSSYNFICASKRALFCVELVLSGASV
jgi:hypothetical protein